MGKKYLDTKKGTLESSILGVWKTAIEEGDARMDGRTKEYREHRKKLESARSRRLNKEEVELDEGKMKELHGYIQDGKSAEEIAKIMKLDVKTIKALMSGYNEEIELDEKPADFIRLSFNSPADVKKAKKWMDQNLPGADQGFTGVDASGKDIEFEGVDDAEDLMAKLKKAGFRFKMDYREEVELDEHGDSHVNPKDREELDKAPSDTAKKMKRAKDPAPNQMAEAQSGDKEAYKKFFDAALKKFKVSSPAELKDDQKKKFYDYIDKNWEGDNEKAEGAMSQVREFKIQSMKAALAQIWGMEEGKNPFAEHKGTKPHKHPHEENEKEVVKDGKTDTGKKAAVIDLKPKIKD